MSDSSTSTPPPPWEARVRKVLKQEIRIEEAISLPPADRTEGYDPEVFRADLRLLHNLNEVYIKTKSWRLIEFGMGILGGEGRILHLNPEYDWETYAATADSEGRLITPLELHQFMDECDILGVDIDLGIAPGFQEAIEEEVPEVTERSVHPPEGRATIRPEKKEFMSPLGPIEGATPKRPSSVEDGELELSSKTMVLGRSVGHPYPQVCDRLSKERGEPVFLSVQEYCEYVKSKAPGLEVRRECRLQLNMELQSIDEILMHLERSRDETERKALVVEILEQDIRSHFLSGQRLYSCAFMQAYPDRFPLEAISKFNTKVKCESDCLACKNFIYSLVKPGPNLIRLS